MSGPTLLRKWCMKYHGTKPTPLINKVILYCHNIEDIYECFRNFITGFFPTLSRLQARLYLTLHIIIIIFHFALFNCFLVSGRIDRKFGLGRALLINVNSLRSDKNKLIKDLLIVLISRQKKNWLKCALTDPKISYEMQRRKKKNSFKNRIKLG